VLAGWQAGSVDFWSHYVLMAVIAINTRCVRVHGFTPAEILLGFNPAVTRRVDLPEARDWIGPPVDPSDILGVQAEEPCGTRAVWVKILRYYSDDLGN
jgi:hypothetical protein